MEIAMRLLRVQGLGSAAILENSQVEQVPQAQLRKRSLFGFPTPSDVWGNLRWDGSTQPP